MPKILVWPAGMPIKLGATETNDATSQYRLIEPARCLRAEGADVTVTWHGPNVIWSEAWDSKLSYQPPSHVKAMALASKPDADVIVMQRPNKRWWSDIIPMLQALGIRVVVDVDDRFDMIHPKNKAFDSFAPDRDENSNHQWVSTACRRADVVTCTTVALAKRYGFGHGVILPNRVPQRYLEIPREPRPNTLGWSGAVETHPTDLQVTGGAVPRAMDKHPEWEFLAIGHGNGIQEALKLTKPVLSTKGWVPFAQYAGVLADLEVGIVPLDGIAFNEGKCIESSMRVSTLRGTVTIGELLVGDHVWSVNGWVPVQATEPQPTRDGIEIRTKHGRVLRVTGEHRMWVNGDWLTADQIKPDDVLEVVPGGRTDASGYVQARWPADSRVSRVDPEQALAFQTAVDGPRVAINERWGRFLGLFLGDGTVGQATQVRIFCDGLDADLIASIEGDFRAFGLPCSTDKVTTWGGQVLRRRSVGGGSANLVRFLYGLGFVEWSGVNIAKERQRKRFEIPAAIWKSPATVQAAFLAGLFEADGTCAGASVSFTTKSERLALDVQLLLGTFGIDSSVREKWGTAGGEKRYQSFNVVLRRHGSDIFEKEIGFLSSRKQARLAAITGRPHSNAYTVPSWKDPVVSVRTVEMETVDIQVQGSEFVAEGLRTHNSWLKLSELAALGIPTVASATSDNCRLHAMGIGLLADTPNQWFKRLNALLASAEFRSDLGGKSREAMRSMTYEAHCSRWLEVWEGSTKRQLAKATL